MPELTAEQKTGLKRWERKMRLAGAVIGTIFLLFLGFGTIVQNVASIIYAYLLLFSAAILWGAHVKNSLRCPNCGSRISTWFGMHAYFGLPPKCKQCGVSFQ
jgi:hypothetical protein